MKPGRISPSTSETTARGHAGFQPRCSRGGPSSTVTKPDPLRRPSRGATSASSLTPVRSTPRDPRHSNADDKLSNFAGKGHRAQRAWHVAYRELSSPSPRHAAELRRRLLDLSCRIHWHPFWSTPPGRSSAAPCGAEAMRPRQPGGWAPAGRGAEGVRKRSVQDVLLPLERVHAQCSVGQGLRGRGLERGEAGVDPVRRTRHLPFQPRADCRTHHATS